MSTTWRYYPNPRRITFWRLVKSPHVYNCWMILNSRAMRSFVLILIEISIEKSKYGLLDLRVHKQNDNLVKENWNPILWYERKGDDLHFHFSFLPLSPSLFLLPAALAILAKHKIHCAVVPGLTSSHLKQYSALWYMLHIMGTKVSVGKILHHMYSTVLIHLMFTMDILYYTGLHNNC